MYIKSLVYLPQLRQLAYADCHEEFSKQKDTFLNSTPRHHLEVVLQRILSMEGVIFITPGSVKNQGSEKLSELPRVRNCIMVEPCLPTPNLAFFLLLHEVSVNDFGILLLVNQMLNFQSYPNVTKKVYGKLSIFKLKFQPKEKKLLQNEE